VFPFFSGTNDSRTMLPHRGDQPLALDFVLLEVFRFFYQNIPIFRKVLPLHSYFCYISIQSAPYLLIGFKSALEDGQESSLMSWFLRWLEVVLGT